MTHPFHPLFDVELEFVKRRRNWQADRVYVYDPGGALLSLPVEWTDIVAEDPFVVVAAGVARSTPRGCSSWPSWSPGYRSSHRRATHQASSKLCR